MLGILAFATSVNILGTAEYPQIREPEVGSTPGREILNTLSEVYMNSPDTEYFGSVEDPTFLYFNDVEGEDDENWLFFPVEDSVEIPKAKSAIHSLEVGEIEEKIDEIDEEMERSWMINEQDFPFEELDVSQSREMPVQSEESASTAQHDEDLLPSNKKDLLADLKTQFQRLIQHGYLDESDAVRSLLNGAFDHLLAPEQQREERKTQYDHLRKKAEDSNIFIGPKQSWEYFRFPRPELFESMDKGSTIEQWALDVYRPTSSNVDVCEVGSDQTYKPKMRNLPRPVTGFYQNLLRPLNRKNYLRPIIPFKNYLRPIVSSQDSMDVTSRDLTVVDGLTYAFKDISKLQVVDSKSDDSMPQQNGDYDGGDDSMTVDAQNGHHASSGEDSEDDIWQDYNWPDWEDDEDRILYDF